MTEAATRAAPVGPAGQARRGFAVSPARLPPPRGSYRIEDNVVEARGRGRRLASGWAAPLLQPAPSHESKQHQEDEGKEGAADHGWHRRGQCRFPCGPWGM